LEEESKLLATLLSPFDVVVEAGCMTGRNVKLVTALNKKYMGIDLEEKYIQTAKASYGLSSNVAFFCDDIIHLKTILSCLKIENEKLVVVFPFNSFGNITDNKHTLDHLLREKYNVVIFTYTNSSFANMVRKNYYMRSGFLNLTVEQNANGVRFTSEAGLDSKAFSKEWFEKAGAATNTLFYSYQFSNIGVAYSNIDCKIRVH
jgi:SAM-dependent methyltransferase